MRDLLVIGIVIAGCIAAFRRPWIGIILWNWLSIMNPHRYTWGLAYDAPLAAMAAASTLLGLMVTRERDSPFKGGAATAMVIFMVIITLSWLFGLDPGNDYEQWKKVMKVDLMIIVGLALLHNKQHIFALMWAAAGSLALLGVKGGIFTVMGGGGQRVWGPPGSFIEDNNEFALALILTVPLLRFLQLQLQSAKQRHVLTAAMLLLAIAALGSQSRGALLAITTMALMLWWRGRSRVAGGVVILTAGILMLSFMPESWTLRMQTIETYQQDSSAMGRLSAWSNAWNLAFHYPLGVGFNAARAALFAKYSTYGTHPLAAHSIYFQVLGNHGFIGLFAFMTIGALTWKDARWLRIHAAKIPEARWASDLGAMVQVSMAGFAVGGAFLSLAYFDLPYVLMTVVLLSRRWVESKAWQREPVYNSSWRTIPGLAEHAAPSK